MEILHQGWPLEDNLYKVDCFEVKVQGDEVMVREKMKMVEKDLTRLEWKIPHKKQYYHSARIIEVIVHPRNSAPAMRVH